MTEDSDSGSSGAASREWDAVAGNPSATMAAANFEGPRACGFEHTVDVRTAARFLGVSVSLVYAYVERKQIPHFRMMGRAIRFRLSELETWRRQFHINGGIDE